MLIGLDGNEANVENRVGSGIYAFELLKQFSISKKHRFKVHLKEKPLSDLPLETINYSYKVFGPKKLWTQLALPLNLTFGNKPQVFFSMGHYGPRFSQVPYVITVHDLSYLHFPELFNKDDLYQLTNWTRYSIEKSAHIIAVSKTTKKDIIKNYNVSESKIKVTYEGYDANRFKPQARSRVDMVKSKYKIIGDYIIFVGTIQPRKNVERLIEAFKLVIRNRTLGTRDLKLVIVGKKGWLFDPIFRKVKDLKLGKKVIFTGFVPDNDLPALISGARAYILPSLWEGFGIPVIEAQACGVPVIVSNTSSLPEIAGDGAVLVNPQSLKSIQEGIEKVLNKNKTRQQLIENGLKNISRFSWQQCASETLSILEKVATESE